MKRAVLIVAVVATLAFGACATTYQEEGAVTGGILGGLTGAILDSENPWRGGIIGAMVGAIAGATITDIAVRASREAAQSGRPVEYRTEDGRGRYYAEPMQYDARTKCRKVHERIWEEGRLVKDQVREICEGERYERRY